MSIESVIAVIASAGAAPGELAARNRPRAGRRQIKGRPFYPESASRALGGPEGLSAWIAARHRAKSSWTCSHTRTVAGLPRANWPISLEEFTHDSLRRLRPVPFRERWPGLAQPLNGVGREGASLLSRHSSANDPPHVCGHFADMLSPRPHPAMILSGNHLSVGKGGSARAAR